MSQFDAFPYAHISSKIDVGWMFVKKRNRKCIFDFRKYFFSYRTVNSWIRLPSEIVEAESLNRQDWIIFVVSLTGCLQAVAVLTSRSMKRVKFMSLYIEITPYQLTRTT